jgi:hypothetical protein
MMANAQPKYDSLEYASELKDAGVPEAQAKIQAKALFRVIDQQLVTKQDIKELEAKFGCDIKELEVKIKELEVKLSHDIQNVQRDIKETEAKLTRDIKETEAKLTLNIQAIQLEMKGMENRIIIRLGGIFTVLLGLAVAILKFH